MDYRTIKKIELYLFDGKTSNKFNYYFHNLNYKTKNETVN
jgi:hypothetical protein